MSALVDGALDGPDAERAWNHVAACETCRGQVERETWLKRRLSGLAGTEPSARLLGSLYELRETGDEPSLDPWAVVGDLEARARTRRRTGIVLVGAGSVSAAVLGLAALGGPVGLGGGGSPAASLTRPTGTPTRAVVAPVAAVQGRIPGLRGQDTGTQRDAVAVDGR